MSTAAAAGAEPAVPDTAEGASQANPAKRGRTAGDAPDAPGDTPSGHMDPTGEAIANAVSAALGHSLPTLCAQIAATVREQLQAASPVQPAPQPTPAQDPTLKLDGQIKGLVAKAIDSLVNKLRALNKLRFDLEQQKKAYSDLEQDNPAQPLPEGISPHLRHIAKPLLLHGKGGHAVDKARQQQADRLARQYLGELMLVEIGNCEDLITAHVEELNAKRATLLTDITALFEDTSVPSEVRQQQIAAAGKSFDDESAKTTLKIELERKAALQQQQEKRALLAQKKLEKLQQGEATSITALSRRIANEEFEKRVAAAEASVTEDTDDEEMSEEEKENDEDKLKRLEVEAANDAAVLQPRSANSQRSKNGKPHAGKSPTARGQAKANRGAAGRKRGGRGGGRGAR